MSPNVKETMEGIAELLAEGWTQKDIAAEFDLSASRVSQYVKEINAEITTKRYNYYMMVFSLHEDMFQDIIDNCDQVSSVKDIKRLIDTFLNDLANNQLTIHYNGQFPTQSAGGKSILTLEEEKRAPKPEKHTPENTDKIAREILGSMLDDDDEEEEEDTPINLPEDKKFGPPEECPECGEVEMLAIVPAQGDKWICQECNASGYYFDDKEPTIE